MYKIMSGMYKKMSDNRSIINGKKRLKTYAYSNINDDVSEKLHFLTPKVLAVLEFFLFDPLNEYYEREVAGKTNVSRGSAHKILVMLANVDFLTRKERGRMLMYRLNMKEPTVKQLKIAINTFALKKLVDDLKSYSRRVILFGSCSQGTDTKESDVDLLIVAMEKEPIGKLLSDVNRKNERKIAPIVVDMNEFIRLKKEDKPLYENIERGIILWEQE
jgi:predicted nucleotidyltransferase